MGIYNIYRVTLADDLESNEFELSIYTGNHQRVAVEQTYKTLGALATDLKSSWDKEVIGFNELTRDTISIICKAPYTVIWDRDRKRLRRCFDLTKEEEETFWYFFKKA